MIFPYKRAKSVFNIPYFEMQLLILMCVLNIEGVPQVVLLTKIDKVCKNTSEDLSKIFYNPVIQETVDRVAQIIGLPRSHILPVKNYESEMELDDNVNILTLLTLQHMLHFCDDYMYNYLDQVEEVKMQKLSVKD